MFTTEPVLEAGIASLVNAFRRDRDDHASFPSITQRRQGYEASVALAGRVPCSVTWQEHTVGHLILRIYRNPPIANPAIAIYFHGGCFISGSFTTHHQQLAALAQLSGATIVAVGYRIAPEATYPSAHNDAYEATQWIRQHAQQLGGSPSHMTLVGDSAGGHIALATCLKLRQHADWLPKQQVLIYPMLDPFGLSASYQTYGDDYVITRQMLLSGFELYAGQHLNSVDVNLLQRDDWAGLPPTHIITAECDPLRDEGEQLYGKLMAQGVDAYCQRYLGVIHGFFQLAGVSAAASQCLAHVARLIHAD